MVRLALSALLKSCLVVLLLTSGAALAERRVERDGDDRARGHAYAYGHEKAGAGAGAGPSSSARSVPEFDPAAAGVIGALVAGGGVLLARRRRR